MRAAVLVALVLLVGAFVGGAWWWTHETRDARFPDGGARPTATDVAAEIAAAEAAPSTPIGAAPSDSVEPRRTSVREPEDAKREGPEAPPSDSLLAHVVDAETRVELDDVSVMRVSSGFTVMSGLIPPGAPLPPRKSHESEFIVEHGHSPVTIDPKEPDVESRSTVIENYSYLFSAPGYVRSLQSLDVRGPADLVVALAPAASLVVEIHGKLPEMPPASVEARTEMDDDDRSVAAGERERDAKIRLRRRSKEIAPIGKLDDDFVIAFAQATARIGETTIEDLLPGEILVTVEIGLRSPIVLASQPVHVIARETARVVLDVAPVAFPTLARLAGTLRVPPGATIERFTLDITPRELRGAIDSDWRTLDAKSMEPVAGRNDTWRWDAGELPSGTYSITIHGTSMTKVVDLPPRGATNVALEVPTHATLRVRVVSSRDGSPVKLSWLDWTPAREEGAATGVSPILLLYDEATRTFVSSVPIGRGEIESFGADLWALDEATRAEIFPGEQELVARVHPIGGASLALSADGKPLEVGRRVVDAITVAPVGRSGPCIWKRLRDRSPAFAVDPPGRYVVTLPKIAGYEQVAPFEVDVVVGTFAKVPVELRRE
jgi:hypothetical protein